MGGAGLQAQCPFTPNFTASSVYVNQGATVTFTNTSSGTVTFQNWYDNGTLFSSGISPTRTFNTPGFRTILLVSTNGTCVDTASTIVNVSPTLGGGLSVSNPTCFNGTNGSINLTPSGGHPNLSLDNNRTINDYSTANAVTGAGYGGGITVEAWLKPRSTWLTGDGLAVAFNNQVGTFNRFFIGYNPDFQQFVYFDDNLGNQFQAGTSPRGFWYHVAVTISSGNVMTMYVNGVVKKTVTTNGNWVPIANELFSIGQEWDNAGSLVTSQHFDGQIDEVRIWNAVLSPATITSNFSGCMSVNSSHPNWANLVSYYSLNEGSGTFLFDRSGNNRHGSRINGTAYGTAATTNWGCFSGGTGYGYSWSNAATTEDISSIGAGSYTVTVTDGGGATKTLTTTVSNPAQVVVTFNPVSPITICAGASAALNATGANIYAWSPGTGLSGTSGPTVTATPAGTTTYTCVGTNAVGCTGTSTIQVIVNPLPTPAITGTNVICNGQSTTLLANGGVTYLWSNGPVTASNTVSPTTTTTYTVTATNSFNCTATAARTVTVNPLPTVGITGDTTLCLGDTTTVTASGGTSYVWNNGPTTAGNTIIPPTTTTYTVTVTDANTCSRSRAVTVTVNPLPIVTFSGIDTICTGDTTTITAAGGTGYAWSNGALTAAVVLGPTVTTTYTVTVTDANACRNSGTQAITVNALPVLSFVANDTICDGDTALITVSGAQSYAWGHGPLTASVNVNPSIDTYYNVMGTDSNGCAATDSLQITVNALPTVTITGIDTLCAGDTTLLMGGGANTYVWNTGDLTPDVTVTPVGTTTYTLTGTDLNGCENATSLAVVVNALPVPVITGPDSLCVGGSITLVATGGGTYFWDVFSADSSITVAPTSNTTYTVTVTSSSGCEASTTHNVTVNALPGSPVITQAGNTMSTTAGFASYQWFLNGNAITGATSNSYIGSVSGNYTVVVTNGSGCAATSSTYNFTFVAISQGGFANFGLSVYPNPNGGRFTVQLDLERDRNMRIAIYDLVGQQVWSHTGDLPFGEWKQAIDLSTLSKGTYLLQVVSEGEKAVRKIVVE